jgi:hypothetical protein
MAKMLLIQRTDDEAREERADGESIKEPWSLGAQL